MKETQSNPVEVTHFRGTIDITMQSAGTLLFLNIKGQLSLSFTLKGMEMLLQNCWIHRECWRKFTWNSSASKISYSGLNKKMLNNFISATICGNTLNRNVVFTYYTT